MRAAARFLRLDEIESAWPAIKGHVEEALSHSAGRLAPDDVKALLATGDMQACIIFLPEEERLLATICTEVMEYPRAKVLDLALCAGERMDLWLVAMPWMESFAREQGCTQIQVQGRPGWARVLASRGFSEASRLVVKEVSHG